MCSYKPNVSTVFFICATQIYYDMRQNDGTKKSNTLKRAAASENATISVGQTKVKSSG